MFDTPISNQPTDLCNLPYELEILRGASNYQKWIRDSIVPFLGNRIMEVGAGIGNLSQHLPLRELLVLSELEQGLNKQLSLTVESAFGRDDRIHFVPIDLSCSFVDEAKPFNLDTIVSFNVLEHLADDREVLRQFLEILRASDAMGPKRIVTLVPAHRWAFGSLDETFGHYRRYAAQDFRQMVRQLGFRGSLHLRYFNLFGLPGWIYMNHIKRAQHFNRSAIQVFESVCRYIRPVDDFLHGALKIPLGQSLIAVMTLDNWES